MSLLSLSPAPPKLQAAAVCQPNGTMMSSEREAFHVAKLALMNVRLLADVERARTTSPEVARIVDLRTQADRLQPPVSVLHQATFLQFGYVCLVWLWERAKASQHDARVIEMVEAHFEGAALRERVRGARRVDGTRDVIRLVRNAISHGRVECLDDRFVFEDRGPGEASPTTVWLTWPEFDQLSQSVLAAMNTVLYG